MSVANAADGVNDVLDASQNAGRSSTGQPRRGTGIEEEDGTDPFGIGGRDSPPMDLTTNGIRWKAGREVPPSDFLRVMAENNYLLQLGADPAQDENVRSLAFATSRRLLSSDRWKDAVKTVTRSVDPADVCPELRTESNMVEAEPPGDQSELSSRLQKEYASAVRDLSFSGPTTAKAKANLRTILLKAVRIGKLGNLDTQALFDLCQNQFTGQAGEMHAMYARMGQWQSFVKLIQLCSSGGESSNEIARKLAKLLSTRPTGPPAAALLEIVDCHINLSKTLSMEDKDTGFVSGTRNSIEMFLNRFWPAQLQQVRQVYKSLEDRHKAKVEAAKAAKDPRLREIEGSFDSVTNLVQAAIEVVNNLEPLREDEGMSRAVAGQGPQAAGGRRQAHAVEACQEPQELAQVQKDVGGEGYPQQAQGAKPKNKGKGKSGQTQYVCFVDQNGVQQMAVLRPQNAQQNAQMQNPPFPPAQSAVRPQQMMNARFQHPFQQPFQQPRYGFSPQTGLGRGGGYAPQNGMRYPGPRCRHCGRHSASTQCYSHGQLEPGEENHICRRCGYIHYERNCSAVLPQGQEGAAYPPASGRQFRPQMNPQVVYTNQPPPPVKQLTYMALTDRPGGGQQGQRQGGQWSGQQESYYD